MTQKSWPWSTVTGLGDGAAELNEALSREFLAVYFGVRNPAVEGVSKGVGGGLAVSGSASPLSVASGSGICYGLYINDAAQNTPAIATPAVGTTGGRVVLQTNWAGTGGASLEARTRIAVKMSTDGVASIPALTQSFGTTWEISLATFTITTGGVITVTDARTFRQSTMEVSNDALRQSAGQSVIGRALGTTGAPADIVASVDNRVLARTPTSIIDFVQINNQMIAVDTIDDTHLGNRVPQFYRRQGGDANDWSITGTATQTPGPVRIQAGVGSTAGGVALAVTFPVAFSNKPLLFVTNKSGTDVVHQISAWSATGFTIIWHKASDPMTVLNIQFDWMAIGPE